MSSNDGFSAGRETVDNPLSRAMNRIAIERLKNAEHSNSLYESPVQEKSYSTQRRVIPSLLGNNRSSTPIQSKTARTISYQSQQKRSLSPTKTYSPSFEGAYMRHDHSIMESPGPVPNTNTYPSELALNPINQSLVLDTGTLDQPSVMANDFDASLLLAKKLHDEKGKLTEMNARISRENFTMRQNYDAASKELLEAKAELVQIRQIAASTKEDVKAREVEKNLVDKMCAEMKTELATMKDDNHRLTHELSLSKTKIEQLKKTLDKSRTTLAHLSETYASSGATLRELGQAHDVSQHSFRVMVQEFEDTKRLAKNGLNALQPMLNDDGTLARAAETKETLKALQEELSSSHQVTDILRDKLLDHASQLADARGRIKDLEVEKMAFLEKLILAKEDGEQKFNLIIAAVEKTTKELNQKLVDREREAIELMTASASCEESLKTALAELNSCKAACAIHATEREENVSKLLALQDVINNRDKEIITLKSELRALKESKEDLRILLAEAKKDLAEKEVEIKSRDPNIDFQIKIKDLTDELAASGVQFKAAQEAWSSQEATLTHRVQVSETAKSELRGHNERLQIELDKVQSEIRTISSKETAFVVKQQCLQEELQRAKGDISHLKERLEAQRVEYSDLNLENSKLKVRLEEHNSYSQSRDQRVLFAETQLNTANRRIEELVHENGSLSLAIASAKDAVDRAAVSNDDENRAQILALQNKISQLEGHNAELVNRANTLKDRYRHAKLSEVEKSFVSLVVTETRGIQEEELVKKDNELRSRDRLVESLNVKLVDAQQTISRLLEEKNAIENSMVGLKRLRPDGTSIKTETILGSNPVAFDPLDNDSEDDIPLSDHLHALNYNDDKSINKRSRSLSPPVPKEESKRTKRRLNASNVSKIELSNNSAVPGAATKSTAGQAPPTTATKYKSKNTKKRT